MSRLHPKALASIVLVCVLSSCAHTAQITGTVQFPDGTPVEGAEVHLFDSYAAILVMREIKKGTATTDHNGRFRFDRVTYSHTLGLRILGRDCHWWVGGTALFPRDTTPPEEYDVKIPLLRDECK